MNLKEGDSEEAILNVLVAFWKEDPKNKLKENCSVFTLRFEMLKGVFTFRCQWKQHFNTLVKHSSFPVFVCLQFESLRSSVIDVEVLSGGLLLWPSAILSGYFFHWNSIKRFTSIDRREKYRLKTLQVTRHNTRAMVLVCSFDA